MIAKVWPSLILLCASSLSLHAQTPGAPLLVLPEAKGHRLVRTAQRVSPKR